MTVWRIFNKHSNKFADKLIVYDSWSWKLATSCRWTNCLSFVFRETSNQLSNITDNHLRNAIAHYKVEYDDVTQIITYYPKREGIKQEKKEEIYFLDFMRKLLMSYREMHKLHQLIKCLYYYYFLIYSKIPK